MLAGMGVEPGNRKTRARNLKSRGQVMRNNTSGLDHKADRKMLKDFPKREVNCDRHDRELWRPQHHDRPQCLARRFPHQRCQKLRVTGFGKSPIVEDVLGDGVGDDRRGRSRHDIRNRAANGGHSGRGARTIRMTWLGAYRDIKGNNRQCRAKRSHRGRRRHRCNRNIAAQPTGTAAEKIRVGHNIEWRNVEFGASMPDRKCKVGADSSRLADGQSQWLHDFASAAYLPSGILYSIIAERRKFSR